MTDPNEKRTKPRRDSLIVLCIILGLLALAPFALGLLLYIVCEVTGTTW